MPRLPPIRSFVCYYGPGQVDEMARYDLATIETDHHTRADVERMRARGTVVLGYLSVGEILEDVPGELPPRAHPDDPALGAYYLDGDGDGKPDRNPGWGGLYVDPRSPVWRRRILEELIPARVRDRGVDGLFLDTLDTVDVYPAVRTGMVDLVRQIREAHPRMPLVANRGFEMIDGLAGLVDGFLFEAFTTRYDPETGTSTPHPPGDLEWVDGVLERIRRAGNRHGVQVLVLDYASCADSEPARRAIDRARRAGLTWSLSVGSLDRLPLAGGPGALRPPHPGSPE